MLRLPHNNRTRIQLTLVIAFLATFFFGVRYAANWIEGGYDSLELQDAIVRGDMDAIQRQLSGISSPNARNPVNGQAALHVAVANGNLEVVKLLFDNGADPNLKDDRGQSPLFLAVQVSADATRMMLDHGARVDDLDNLDTSALHWAAYLGKLESVKLLTAHGAPLHGVSKVDFGPIGTPAGAALQARNVDSKSRAVIANHILFEAGKGDLGEEDLDALLHTAAFAGDSDLMKRFAEAGANPYDDYVQLFPTSNSVARTSLLENAVMSNSADAVRTAIDLGADPLMPKDPLQRNLLSRTFNPDILKLLIDHGLDVNLADSMGQTPLHGAARLNAVDAARVLIEAGADVNARTTYGETPLYIAVEAASVHVLMLLLANGADPTIPEGNGGLPAALARQAVLRVDTPENPPTIRDNAKTVLDLLERHANQP